MKKLFKLLAWLCLIIGLVVAGAYFTGNQFLLKGLWAAYLHGNTSATIGDAQFFETRTVDAGKEIPWKVADNFNQIELSDRLRTSLEETRSVAFLMARDGELIFEEYWDGYSESSRSNSFSMAKSITTMLVQCAIQDGYVKSWDQPVKDFLPELKGEFADELTLRHLSTMTAGLDFNEHYTNPFDITAKMYYGPDVERLLLEEVPVVKQPGLESFEYQSGATQLLGLCLMRATEKPQAEYASDKLWKPLGAKHSAEWHLDSEDGKELSFCCFNSNARDFARFGQMMLQRGNYNGVQLLDSAFVDTATVPFAVPYYGHSFWVTDDYGSHIYYQRGILGQYIIVIPEYETVVVRLGHKRLGSDMHHSIDFRLIIEEVLEILPKNTMAKPAPCEESVFVTTDSTEVLRLISDELEDPNLYDESESKFYVFEVLSNSEGEVKEVEIFRQNNSELAEDIRAKLFELDLQVIDQADSCENHLFRFVLDARNRILGYPNSASYYEDLNLDE